MSSTLKAPEASTRTLLRGHERRTPLRLWPVIAIVASALTQVLAQAPPLLPNGDFERADTRDAGKPAFWDKPDGLGVQWVQLAPEANAKGRGRAIRMDTAVSEKAMVAQWQKAGITQWSIPKPANSAIAETYGLSFYSDPIPVRPGQAYRVTFDYRGASGGAKLWVRGWGQVGGVKRRRWETIVNCRVNDSGWTTFSQVFHPTKARPDVTEMRVMLFAYYPAGLYWFDNIRIEPVDEPATPQPGDTGKRP
jgi:hypothetical protein